MSPNPCRNPSCENTVSDQMVSGFCFMCSSDLAHQEKELDELLGRLMPLAAEFAAWCEVNGQPSPYED